MSESNIMAYVNNSPFSRWRIMSNLSSLPIVFHKFFAGIALSDWHLCFSLILVTEGNAVEGGTTSAA
jgi:hypothetical protein